jgi:hypothetical protein
LLPDFVADTTLQVNFNLVLTARIGLMLLQTAYSFAPPRLRKWRA